jgi:tetratricopeptide (TPR) repeat protein
LLTGATAAAPPKRPADARLEADLRARAQQLFELREKARDGGVPLEPLQRDLIAVAESLETAGLDSVAAMARFRAAGVLSRMARDVDAEQQLTISIADAVRARDVPMELRARALLLDWRSARNPEQAMAAVEELARRYQALGDEQGLGHVRTTEARIWASVGRWRESLAASKQAVRHYANTSRPREQAIELTRSSQALRFLGRHPEALVLADSAIRLASRNKLNEPIARGMIERSATLRAMGQTDEAIAAANEAIAIDLKTGDRAHLTGARTFRGTALRQAGRYAEALADADSVLASVSAYRDPGFVLRAHTARAMALVGLGRVTEADTLLARQLELYERRVVSMDAGRDRAAARVHASAAYVTRARCQLALGGPEAGWRTLEQGLALELKDRLGEPVVPELAPIMRRLQASRAALVCWIGGDDAAPVALLLDSGRIRAIELPAIDYGLDVEGTRELLGSGGADAEAARTAVTRIARAWFDDVARAIPSGIERLIVVPSSSLLAFPHEALPLPGANGATVGDRWATSYLPSAGQLTRLAALPASKGPVIAFADPHTKGFPALPQARVEAKQATYGGGTVHTGRAASADRLEQVADEAAVLHFATHAVADPARPLQSGLRLTGRGAVTPADVESLTVKADLVVLSACRGVQGPQYYGEGTLGLARAFMASGARSVVTTLWDVDDRAAAAFMTRFYEGLRGGLPRDEALRRARRAMTAEGVPPRDLWTFVLEGLGDEPVPALSRGRPDQAAK